MLVLSRLKNQSIIIGRNIKIKIIDIAGKKVRIGIDAPSDVSIDREEIFKQNLSLSSSEVFDIVKNMNYIDKDDFQESYLEDLEKEEGILTFQPSSLAEKMEFEKWRDKN